MKRKKIEAPEHKRIIGYARVSTGKQAVSLEAQEDKIRAMVNVHDGELLEVIVDEGESAKSLDRPGVIRLLKLVTGGAIDMVIIAKLDRLTRSVRDLAELLEMFKASNVALVSVAESLDTSSASGRLVLNIMTSVSQWEREAIGERTRTVLQFKKAQGRRVGTVPFGFRLLPGPAKLMEAHPEEQSILKDTRRLRKAGYTLAWIAVELNRLGYRTRTGAEWKIPGVQGLLRVA